MRLHPRSPLLFAVAAFALAALLWAAVPYTVSPLNLAADLPPGALMTLESADFATLLNSWTQSPEQRAWLSSASYSAFANSRLFNRLADAQKGFASAAHTPVDSSLLQQVAGKESIFAWYNIGNLEFLYVTHLSQAQIAAFPLLQQQANFARRESAGTSFYVRTGTDTADGAAADTAGTTASTPGEPTNLAPSQDLDQPRTVAFALRGDWLLLATREDLLANALQLMASQGRTQAPPDSEATVGWFAAASAAGPQIHGDLHMLLDLQSLTKTPQFRTYWIQRNVTDTRRFRAAVVDLYREPHRFHEERVLLPMEPPTTSDQPDLGQLESLVPSHTGVYRALAHPAPDLILYTLNEKLLNGSTNVVANLNNAPPSETDDPVSGSANNLDVHIDAASARPESALQASAEALIPLRRVLDATQVESMLTVGRSEPTEPTLPFIRFQSAVILRSATPWSRDALTQAISEVLRLRLTTGSLGLTWQEIDSLGKNCFSLAGAQPLALCTDGPLAILSNDLGMLSEVLSRRQDHPATQPAELITAIYPGQERANFQRLTTQLGQLPATAQGTPANASLQLFRDTLPSLAGSFSDVVSEHILVRNDGPVVRQSVVYKWTGRQGAQP